MCQALRGVHRDLCGLCALGGVSGLTGECPGTTPQGSKSNMTIHGRLPQPQPLVWSQITAPKDVQVLIPRACA